MKKVPLRLNQENMATSVGRETKIFSFDKQKKYGFITMAVLTEYGLLQTYFRRLHLKEVNMAM